MVWVLVYKRDRNMLVSKKLFRTKLEANRTIKTFSMGGWVVVRNVSKDFVKKLDRWDEVKD